MVVGDAGIQVNSEADCGACGNGSRTYIEAGIMNVVGTACFHQNAEMDIDLGIHEGQNYVDDPLAYLPDPAWNPAQDLGCIPCGQACDSGPNEDHACETDADCAPEGLCVGGGITACDDGAREDKLCSTDADCLSRDPVCRLTGGPRASSQRRKPCRGRATLWVPGQSWQSALRNDACEAPTPVTSE